MKLVSQLKYLVLFVIFFLSSCCDDEKLVLNKTSYSGTELRTGGYYYEVGTMGESVGYNILFLYSNGIMFSGSVVRESELDSREEEYKNGTWYENNKKYMGNWGIFKINGNDIAIESFEPSDCSYLSRTTIGKILNDSTFHISKGRDSDGSTWSLDETYFFKQFSQKPDSTNNFIN